MSSISKTSRVEQSVLIAGNEAIGLLIARNLTRNLLHVDLKYYIVRELWKNKEVDYVYINTIAQLADLFTKPLPRDRFQQLRQAMGMTTLSSEWVGVYLLILGYVEHSRVDFSLKNKWECWM